MKRLREFVRRGLEAQRALDELLLPPPSFRCPDCGRVSYNATDVAQRYCGACHKFFAP